MGNKNIIWNLGWMKMIGWLSVILFLMDYSKRTGDWWFEIIALFFAVTSIGAVIEDILKSKEWEEESYYSKLKNKWRK